MALEMLSVQEATQRLVGNIKPVGKTRIEVRNALDRVLFTDILSPINYPLFNNSSMDGIAVVAKDVLRASQAYPIWLDVVGDIPAGVSPDFMILPGQAARVMTGAALPKGADSVVPIESTDQTRGLGQSLPKRVLVIHPAHSGDFIRPEGQDFKIGQTLLKTGRRLNPQDLGLLTMLGISRIDVYKRPRIALLSSGDELITVGQTLGPGQIYDSNSVTLSSLLHKAGVEQISLGIAKDQYVDIKNRLDISITNHADLIISSAGVSVGTYDYMRQVIIDHGDLDFWQVNMRPGKPFTFGHYKGIPIIGLPGNPVSAFVAFKVFVDPVCAKLSGRMGVNRQIIEVELTVPIESDGRESYLRAIVEHQVGKSRASLTGHQGSGNLLSLVDANALLIVPSGVKSLPAGTMIQAWLLDDNG